MFHKVSLELGGKQLTFETGKMARQAHGSVVARYGDTVLLATACMDTKATEKDFMPLTVDYREYTYAAGKIPGGFFKREGRPTEREILTSRLTDRPLRPMFPEGYATETQIVAMVLSADSENDTDVIAVTAASAALCISWICRIAFCLCLSCAACPSLIACSRACRTFSAAISASFSCRAINSFLAFSAASCSRRMASSRAKSLFVLTACVS